MEKNDDWILGHEQKIVKHNSVSQEEWDTTPFVELLYMKYHLVISWERVGYR